MGLRAAGLMGMVAATVAATAQAESALGPVFSATLADEPHGGALAMVGLGLLVLTVFAKRRRDP